MLLLNIFQHSDGTFAWDTILLLLVALIAGFMLQRYSAKKNDDRKYANSIAESEAKYKKLDNEFKNYKSNINSSEKHNDKSLVQLAGRVKSLEGDIRVLSDEKNKLNQQLLSKDEEIKRYSKLNGELEDTLKVSRESKIKGDAEASDKLKTVKEELAIASAWEKRVRTAEADAEKARSAIGNAERKKLEAELRLKATTEYAAKVGPLETELATIKQQVAVFESTLKEKSGLSEEVIASLKTAAAQLELQKENNKTLQHEIEIKNNEKISLVNEIEYLKTTLARMANEYEMLKSKFTAEPAKAENIPTAEEPQAV